MLEEQNQSFVKEILSAGAAVVEIRGINGGLPFVTVPEGYSVNDLEKFLPSPIRKRGNVVTTDTASFSDYLNKHSTQFGSVIYAEIDSEKSVCRMVAVLDDHSDDAPQWKENICRFSPKLSVEWVRWLSKNKSVMNQADFATWLEDNLPDIATVPGMPSGSEILAMALGFEANSDKRLHSKINLQSGGVQFNFVEDETKDTRTAMKVFERFTVGIPVFDGSTGGYPIEARLKYRQKDNTLNFWYELIRPDRVFKTAVAEELSIIKENTGLLVISGINNL